MDLRARVAAMLEVVRQHRAARCAALWQPAREQADTLLRAALSDARRRVLGTLAEERARLATTVAAAQAQLATERRLRDQRRAAALLDTGWQALRAALIARWDTPATRGVWVSSQLERAPRALPLSESTQPCRLQGPTDWPAQEQARALAYLRGVLGSADRELRYEADPAIRAGFRIIAGHNTLDATLDGLLADRRQLEGRLLQALQAGEATTETVS